MGFGSKADLVWCFSKEIWIDFGFYSLREAFNCKRSDLVLFNRKIHSSRRVLWHFRFIGDVVLCSYDGVTIDQVLLLEYKVKGFEVGSGCSAIILQVLFVHVSRRGTDFFFGDSYFQV